MKAVLLFLLVLTSFGLVSCSQETAESCQHLRGQIINRLVVDIKHQANAAARGEDYLRMLKAHEAWAASTNGKIGSCEGLSIANNASENDELFWEKANLALAWLAASEKSLSIDDEFVGWQSSRQSLLRHIEDFESVAKTERR